MNFVIEKAVQTKTKARIALDGPAGCGKTFSALVLAQQLGQKVVVIDTERGSSAKYARIWEPFEFDVLKLDPPYSPKIYVEAIHFCEEQKYDVIIIDSLTHAWAGEGGALDTVDKNKVKYSNNSYYAWRDVTPQHNALVDAMLNSTAHVIATMRTKTQYAEEERNGKKTYTKIGTAAIQREGMDYEFDIVMDINLEHQAVVSKTRMNSIADMVYSPIDSKLGKLIKAWADEGIDAPPRPVVQPAVEVPVEEPTEEKKTARKTSKKTEAPAEAPANGNGITHTSKDLITWAEQTYGIVAKDVSAALKSAGYTKFESSEWENMQKVIADYMTTKVPEEAPVAG